jgi:diacylglycerol kinase (ATP)
MNVKSHFHDSAESGGANAINGVPAKGQIKGWRRLRDALGYSRLGLLAAYRHEEAFRQECWLAACLTVLACVLPVSPYERLALIVSLLIVLIVELLNSAVEAVTDRVSRDLHELAGRAKDMGSAAVLLSLVLCIMVWSVILVKLWFP